MAYFYSATLVEFYSALDNRGCVDNAQPFHSLSVGTKVATASTEQSMATDSNRFFEKVYEGTSAALLQ